MGRSRHVAAILLVGAVVAPRAARARDALPSELSLPEAVDLAFRHNYQLHRARLDARIAGQRVRQAWSGVYPQIDGRASYTRTIGALNPFAGSEASDLIAQGQAGFFLASDDNPDPALRDAFVRFIEAQAPEPGEVVDNPFFIENLFSAQVGVTQVLYDGALFGGVGVARSFEDSQQAALQDVVRLLTQRVATAYYGALLAEARLEVLRRSETRSQSEVKEAEILVAEGLQPRTTRLSAEVQLTNTRTERLRAENEAATAAQNLNVLLGVPFDAQLRLRSALAAPAKEATVQDLDAAVETAVEQRPDLQALRAEIERQNRSVSAVGGEYLPRLEAFFVFRTIGQVPDDRGDQDFFSNRFWGPDITGGVAVTWNFFNGFDSTSRRAQAELGEARARVDHEERLANVRAEVARELRDLTTALDQIRGQENNVDRAVRNYEETRARVQEGVTGRAELRNASQQLDESRLNLLQAIHDYRVASVDYRAAVGLAPVERGSP